ncbi:S8 family serine peptidase, partial [bacterium AH-315-P15]|nr:S8 family serine peptidase [bacterium AH-315-P15]
MRWTSFSEILLTGFQSRFFGSPETLIAGRMLIPTDTLFGGQWHLLNTGQSGGTPGVDINVVDVWDDYTGAGVIVGIVDDSVSYTHPDLDDNYDTSLDRDAVENDNDAYPTFSDDNHGTAVAGVIAAEKNGSNVVGVAYGATITGLRIGFTSNDGPSQPAANYNYAAANGIDILNNSWGYSGFFDDADDFNHPAFFGLAAALENLVENGRDGLGTIVFFSSGNSGDQGQDANYHNLLNSRYTIAVGAIDRTGVITDFSTPGAPVFVVLPGQRIITTDREGSAGYARGSAVSVDGTSFSSPIGAGIAALILEANPDLGWRDVQEIFALSAIQLDSSHSSWTINGADNWNGGGLHTSRWYGFGLTDTLAAVRLAETWTLQSTSANEVSVSGASSPGKAIPDLGTITDTITINSGVNIDHVVITLNISHTAPVDLIVTLISPDGTESQIIVQPGLVPGSDTTPQGGAAGDDGIPSANISFTLSSTEFWGETGEGTWTIRVEDTLSQDSGTLNSWSIELFGDALTDDTTYYYTDEYATFAASDASRRTLIDDAGINTINAAAVTSNLVLDLSGNSQSTIAGTALILAAGTIIHHAYAGDGDDTLIGNAFDNNLLGGRGDDTISGGDGIDTVMYFSDSTEFTFTILSPTEIQVSYTGSNGIDEGTDVVTGVEFFEFADTTLTKSQVVTLAGGSLGPVFTSLDAANFAENGVGVAYDADATDEDSAAPTYAITGGADAALFSIDGTTGEVTFNASPDFEAPADVGGNNVYNIEITASSGGDDTVQAVAITVTNVNDNLPVFDSGPVANFPEASTGVAYNANANDADGPAPTYSITGGVDAALFNIDGTTGEVTFIAVPDFEAPGDVGGDNIYNIEVTASSQGDDTVQAVAITVTDVSGPPTFSSGATANFAENGTGVAYDANATSPDGPAPTYAITGGADAALFSIDGSTGEVTFNASPDFESPSDAGADNTYNIAITASSGAQDTVQNVAITVTDVNDVAPVFTSLDTASFAENGTGTVYQATTTDVDGNARTYSITGGADAALFNIDTNSGEVTFKNPPDFENPADAGADNVYNIDITANDGLHDTIQSVAITVTDVANEFNIINGTAGDDELDGTAAADQINGLGGADRIDGGAGIDELNGGEGDDVFLAGVGDGPDTYNGGGGTDTIAAVEAGTTISFAGGAFGPGNSIELITNSDPASASTTLTGTDGADTLDVSAETIPYILDGLGGNDTLLGGAADDRLIGGAGNDRLTGNGGADEFVFSDGSGTDRIIDFDPASGDVINLAGVTGVNNFADVQAAMSTIRSNTLITLPDGTRILVVGMQPADFSADDFSFTAPAPLAAAISRDATVPGTTISGTSGDDDYDFSATTLTGIDSIDMGAGNDTVAGSDGADVINGDAGDDSLEGRGGDDTITGGAESDTAVFSGNRADYTATQIDGDSVTITD